MVLQQIDADGDAGPADFEATNRYLYGVGVDQLLADEQLPSTAVDTTDPLSGPSGDPTVGDPTWSDPTVGDDSVPVDNVLWALTDHLGSVRDLVDSSGTRREHIHYDTFGNVVSETDYDASGNEIASDHAEAVDTLFGYTGREWDEEAELQFNRARWYDPEQGRWLSQDPIGFAAGDANLYRYVGNGSTTKTDPSGLEERLRVPSQIRGKWIKGTPGNGIFEFFDNETNRKAGIAKAKVTFRHGHVQHNGFPESWYYKGSYAKSYVYIPEVKGTNADADSADVEMRKKLRDPDWKRPDNYTWHHAGKPGSRRMELVESSRDGCKSYRHSAVAHRGSAWIARSKAFAVIEVYGTVKEFTESLVQGGTVVAELHQTHVFADIMNESGFIVYEPGFFTKAELEYISGPMKGTTQVLTSEQFEYYKELYYSEYGRMRYRPFFGRWFDPGTKRKTFQTYDPFTGQRNGYYDEDGWHDESGFAFERGLGA